MHDVIVIGGGIIGLSIARELAGRKSVRVVDRGPAGQGTSRAAAGMLAPLSEAEEAGPLFDLCRASHELYPAFAAEVQAESGLDVGYAADGALVLASTEEAAAALHRRHEWQRQAGMDIRFLCPDQARAMEPLLTAPLHAAVYIPGESAVVPRRLVTALAECCRRRGVDIRTGRHVQGISEHRVHLDGGETLSARYIVIAAGVWSAGIAGLNPPIPVTPRRGQILSLRMPEGAFRHVIRCGSSYFVPRRPAELVVGATSEDAGFDLANTPAGLGRLLHDAQHISSHTGAYPILDTWSGLRPATPDGLPIIGPGTLEDVFYATGHYRNGILLAPVTAAILSDLIEKRAPRLPVEPYLPSRFATRHV